MKLMMVRHAESQGNATGLYSARDADSLSGRGREQARALADALRSWEFGTILVSPMERAMQTIAPYLLATRRRAELWPEIAEACWHDKREPPAQRWNPRPGTLSDVDAAHFHHRGDQAVRPGHPESFGEGLCRVHAAMDLLQEMAGRTDHLVLMVTHGHFIRELLNVMLDTRRPIHVAQSNCGMTLMSHQGGWGMEFCNRVIEPR